MNPVSVEKVGMRPQILFFIFTIYIDSENGQLEMGHYIDFTPCDRAIMDSAPGF